MRAEKSQIPGKSGQSISQSNAGTKPVDALWSHLRRLTDQVKSIELALSTARRDINRIDRKQYREVEKSPPSEIPGDGQPPGKRYEPALFG